MTVPASPPASAPAPAHVDAAVMLGSLPPCWRAALAPEFAAPYMQDLLMFLARERAAGQTIYPPDHQLLAALHHTPLDRVRAVILGQDPYHGPGQAHGLSFSVPPGVRPPPSLVNIFKERTHDLGLPRPVGGDLRPWADAGVLLLNSVLTVAAGRAGSHRRRGWERFTDAIIRIVAAREQPAVFLLWGTHAQAKAGFVTQHPQHAVLPAVHPSPLSAHGGWFGSRPFSRANQALAAAGQPPIDWSLPGDDAALLL